MQNFTTAPILDKGILVVDDDPSYRELLELMLRTRGFTNVRAAGNGRQAIDILKTGEAPELVITDVMMPEVDGFGLLDFMMSQPALKGVPVLMISGINEVHNIIRSIERGAVDYLLKPFEEALFFARVRTSLERKYYASRERELFREVETAKGETERLLFSILPENIAARLRSGEADIAETIQNCTVLFADLVDFSLLAMTLNPKKLLEVLNEIFQRFDNQAEKHGLEKIKTVGDCYMAAAGVGHEVDDHAERCVQFGLAALAEVENLQLPGTPIKRQQLRVGAASGPVVAGVLGQKRYSFDIWGRTVNLASRMESCGIPGHIQIAPSTYLQLKSKALFVERGPVQVKGPGEISTYVSREQEVSAAEVGAKS